MSMDGKEIERYFIFHEAFHATVVATEYEGGQH